MPRMGFLCDILSLAAPGWVFRGLASVEQTDMVGRLDDVGRGLASSPRLPHLRRRPTGARGGLADQGLAGWSGRAPLEYWFFRTSWADGALLVDVISRRHEGTVELRVSSQDRGTAQINRLVREHRAGPASDPAQVVGCVLTLRSSRGSCGPITWELDFAVDTPPAVRTVDSMAAVGHLRSGPHELATRRRHRQRDPGWSNRGVSGPAGHAVSLLGPSTATPLAMALRE